MPSTVRDERLDIQRKPVAARLRPDTKGECKPLAASEDDWRRKVGQAIERALELAHMTKQDASDRMGYPDQSAISKWISGAERPQVDKLLAIEELRPCLVVAFGEVVGAEVAMTITVRRRA